MVTHKNKNASASFHTSRTRIKSSHLAKQKKIDRKVFSSAKKTILTIILFSMLIVVLALLTCSFNNTERLTKQNFSSIVSDYYENYYYPNLVGTASDIDSLEKIMSRYEESGFATISLRQLLLFNEKSYTESAALLKSHCDENKTFVRIYPEAPFGKKNYRVDYTYSCTF